MRLWTLHPCYLDSRGLVALWREALLAQAVLGGHTRGYTHHPQLCRFRDAPLPMAAIATYLHAVHSEANVRGYRFNATKIVSERNAVHIVASRGQLDYEWKHLVEKLRARDPSWLKQFVTLPEPKLHPLFLLVSGPIAEWEVTRANPSNHRALRDKAAQRR